MDGRTEDGRTDGRTDGRRTDGRTGDHHQPSYKTCALARAWSLSPALMPFYGSKKERLRGTVERKMKISYCKLRPAMKELVLLPCGLL